MVQVRVRFAPSPTGYLTVGGARTALYNYLFARHYQGYFILRIEDTDQIRSTPEACQGVLESLNWLGIKWDEGPYFQSERRELYQKYAQRLLDEGKAFYRTDPGKGRAVVFKTHPNTKILLEDMIHGKIQFDSTYLGDIVLIKSDGFPTYNFACVVDDNEMGITHVIRGDDHISNTPKQILLYQALGKTLPRFGHIPLILGEDKAKLSKRHGHNSVNEYQARGYLAEALFNFLALLGWAPGDDTELMSHQEIIKRFTIEKVSHTPAQFNLSKLVWMNSHYIKTLAPEEILQRCLPFLTRANYDLSGKSHSWLVRMVELYRERAKTLLELTEAVSFLFVDEISYQPEAYQRYIKPESAQVLLREILGRLAILEEFTQDSLEKILRDLAKERAVKFQDIAQPIRVALTGTTVSPGIFQIMELAGKELVIKRLEKALNLQK